MTKQEIRDSIRQIRKGLDKEYINSASDSIKNALMPHIENVETVMVYLSSFNEPRTKGIIEELFKRNIRVVVPVSNTDTFTITPSLITSLDSLTNGAYGILEPMEIIPIPQNEIDAVIIPGIAFDKHGTRLGFGKGYYDRFLTDFCGTKIGICYDFQVVPDLPSDSHDIKMDLIITEKRIYNDF